MRKILNSTMFFLIPLVALYVLLKPLQPNTDYHPQYHELEQYLDIYSEIALQGGWEHLDGWTDTLKTGMTDSLVILLRERLAIEKYTSQEIPVNPALFEKDVEKALKRFQSNHGLPPTGFLDAATLAGLNIPVEKRVEQILINMDRWKEFPANPGTFYLLVNVPDFRMVAVKETDTITSMKVVVGSTYRQTPEFQAKMTHIVFNPSWQIPAGILNKDILPKVLADPTYLKTSQIHIFRKGKETSTPEIPVDSLDWASLSGTNFPYTLIQSPGPYNPLGSVKFIFPNRYDVYMHDTPSKDLFSQFEPTFSSGCIRLSEAVDLASIILKDQYNWDQQNVEDTIKSGVSTTVDLASPIDVYITYFTSWVNADGQLQFRKDIYTRDTGRMPEKSNINQFGG